MTAKFAIAPEIERMVTELKPSHGLTVFYVESAQAIVARVLVANGVNATCGRRALLEAIATGSLHAVDYGAIYTDNDEDRGGALRKAFNVNTVQAFAHVHATRLANARNQRAAALNASKPACSASYDALISYESSGGSALSQYKIDR